MRAPEGCGLHTRALPEASRLIALPASVGSECVAGEGPRLQELDPRRLLPRDDQLLDLVRQSPDLRLFELLAPQLVGALDANLAHAIDRLAACIHAERLEAPLGGS